MKKKLALAVATLSLAMAGLSACASHPSELVGQWKKVEIEHSPGEIYFDATPSYQPTEFTFEEDGTGKVVMPAGSVNLTWKASGDEVHIDMGSFMGEKTCTLKDDKTILDCDEIEYTK